MAQYNVDRIENFTGNQVIIWLKDERTGETEDEQGLGMCVRIRVDEGPDVIGQLIGAYTSAMQNQMVHVAAGGCRTCKNKRRVNGRPCSVCIPRAKKRVQTYGKGIG